eukprot:g19938.t1
MGSPISRLIAEAVMQRLESMTLPLIQPKLWIHYVDDTFIVIKRTKLEETHELINNTLTGIRFTKEEEKNKQLPYLDVMVERKTNGEFLTKQEDTTRPNTLITLPYIRNTLEQTTRFLQPLGIRVAHKPTSTLHQQLTRTKDP